MKTKIIALAGMLVLSLVTSMTLAAKPGPDPADKYEDSAFGTVTSGVIKSQNNCPDGTEFFKNQFPQLTNGPDGSVEPRVLSYLIDGTDVTVEVSWAQDNSFQLDVIDGIVFRAGAEIDNDKLIYEYPSPVSADTGLNVLKDGSVSADVNHLDFCLAPVDTTPPVIVFIVPEDTTPPQPPTQVSGTVIVEVQVTDTSGVDPASVTASVYQGGELIADLGAGNLQQDGNYTWDWPTKPTEEYPDAEELQAGFYEIRVSATDLAVPDPNTAMASVDVELVKLFSDCFGTLGTEDFDADPSEPDYAGGCKPTVLTRLQTSPFTQNCDGDNPDFTCFLSGTLLKPDPDKIVGLQSCGEYGFPDPRMLLVDDSDSRCSDPAGCWIPNFKRSLSVFTEIGLHPDLAPGVLAAVQASYPDGITPPTSLANALVLDENTYCANGCCAFAQHVKGYETEVQGVPVTGTQLNVLYPEWPTDALAFIKVHFPLLVLNDVDLVAKCYDEFANADLQRTGGAGYAPLFQSADDSGFLTVLTQTCINPARTLSRNNGFDASNIIVSTAGPGYLDVETSPEAVLSFMYQQSEEDFARVFALLDIIDRDGLLLTGNLNSKVQGPVNQAKRRFDNFNANSLQQSIDSLVEAADGIRTKTTYTVTEANPPGEALSLIEHLIWELGLLKRELIRIDALP